MCPEHVDISALGFSLMLFQTKRVCITFGYNTKSKDQYGVMMYHKNRLIKAYERVGCQQKVSLCCLVFINAHISKCFPSAAVSGVLITPCLLQASYKGVGVIGVIECNFLDPTHNKQSFNETDKYR